jgi:hypothetical protein
LNLDISKNDVIRKKVGPASISNFRLQISNLKHLERSFSLFRIRVPAVGRDCGIDKKKVNNSRLKAQRNTASLTGR